MSHVKRSFVRCGFLLTLLLGGFLMTCYSQSPVCVSATYMCPGGPKTVGCNDPPPCSPSGDSASSSSASSGGGLVGAVLCMFVQLPGCPAKVDRGAEIARQRAHEMNDLGITEYNRGNWAAAARNFELALEYNPSDPVIKQNLENARANLREQRAEERRAAARRERDLGFAAAAKGDWALATLYLQRAALGDPYDLEIRRNLDNAKSQLRAVVKKASEERAAANAKAAAEIAKWVGKLTLTFAPPSSPSAGLSRAGQPGLSGRSSSPNTNGQTDRGAAAPGEASKPSDTVTNGVTAGDNSGSKDEATPATSPTAPVGGIKENGTTTGANGSAGVPLTPFSPNVGSATPGGATSGGTSRPQSGMDDLRSVVATGLEAEKPSGTLEIPHELGLQGWDKGGGPPVAVPAIPDVKGVPVETKIEIKKEFANDPKVVGLQNKLSRAEADREVVRLNEVRKQPGGDTPEARLQLVEARSKADIEKNKEDTAKVLLRDFTETKIPEGTPARAPVKPQ